MSADPKSTYYDVGGIETINIIKAKLPDFVSYLQGNIIKYACRLPYKSSVDGYRDAEKIVIYAKMLRDELKDK